jgi:serine/threonine protein kinase/Tol biopolymer transport system component
MSLTAGSRLGAYEITDLVGEGGMGQVYRAHDTRLGRQVAIKILPDAFAQDPERLERFEREARTLASLNHPNIAVIHGIEEGSGQLALVMELVDGEDLSARIARGPIPFDEAAPIARQIADALEAAHEAGITHRDLKPANVKVREDGTVKLLDFGLAKAMTEDTASGTAHPMNSPTLTARATELGMIIGTAAYMAPEQARGKAVNRRADIWAYGCVLFEMLAGRRPFAGEEISDMLASVIKDEPAWDALPASVPQPVRRLLRRCLEKDPRRRLSAIGDARLELDERAEPATSASPVPTPGRQWSLGTVLVALAAAVVATAGLTLWLGGTDAPDEPLRRLTVLGPQGQTIFRDSANQAISPDGRRLAFITGSSRGDSKLWIRMLDTLTARAVEGFPGAQLPFWSPDSRFVGFFAGGKLLTVEASGGAPQVVADAPDGRGGTWSADGVIVFAPSNAGALSRVSANGGTVTAATTLVADRGETGHRFPLFLPDGRHFLFVALPASSGQFNIWAAELDSDERQLLLTAEGSPVYAPAAGRAETGFLLYSRKGVVVAQPFDARSLTLGGEAIPLGDTPGEMNLEYTGGRPVSAADNGTIAYLSAAELRSRMVWLDQAGREVGAVDVPPGPYTEVALSPDGRRAVVGQLAAPQQSLWWVDVERGGLTPLTGVPGWNASAVWSGDGREVAYSSDRLGPIDIYARAVAGSDDETFHASDVLFKYPSSWSPDGQVLVFTELSPETDNDLWTLRPGGDRTPEIFLNTPGNDAYGTISPDGHWMAYISDQAGHFDAYVQAFPAAGAAHRITTGGTLDWGMWWRADGRQLLIVDASLQLVLVDVATSPDFSASAPRVVGRLRFPLSTAGSMSAAPDLQRLLAVVPEQVDGSRSLTVMLNWQAAIGR